MEVLDLRINNPSIIQISEDFAFSVLQKKVSLHSSDLILETKKISHYPPESENLLSSSPNTHHICQSNLASLGHMGQMHWLEYSAVKVFVCLEKVFILIILLSAIALGFPGA